VGQGECPIREEGQDAVWEINEERWL